MEPNDVSMPYSHPPLFCCLSETKGIAVGLYLEIRENHSSSHLWVDFGE